MKIISHWNINGFDSKKEQLEIYLGQKKIDITCLNETKPTNRTKFEIDGFTLATRRDRANIGGGGVAMHPGQKLHKRNRGGLGHR